jgi:hypothetical protein
MRAPLFKAMGPTITRRMIGDRQPRSYDRGELVFERDNRLTASFA